MGNIINLEFEKDRRNYLNIKDHFDSMEKSKYKLTYLDTFFLNMALLEETERVILDTINSKTSIEDLTDHTVSTASAMYHCYYSFFDSYITRKDSLVSLSLHDFIGILDCIYSTVKSHKLFDSACVRFKDFKFTFEDKSFSADLIMLDYLTYCISKVEKNYYSIGIDWYKTKLADNDCINKSKIKHLLKEFPKMLLKSSERESYYLEKTGFLNIWEGLEEPLKFREFCRNTIVSKIRIIKDLINKHDYLGRATMMLYADEIESKYFDDIKKNEGILK